MDTALAAALLGGAFALIAAVLSAITTVRVNSIRRSLLVEIAESRIAAYRKLWTLTRRASAATPPTQEERNSLEDDLFNWYFEDGHGIFLSDGSRDIIQGLQAQLRDEAIDWSEARRTYSTLRLSLKDDVGIFTGNKRSIQRRSISHLSISPAYPTLCQTRGPRIKSSQLGGS